MARRLKTRRRVSRKSVRKATGKRRIGKSKRRVSRGKGKKTMRVLCPMKAKSCTITCKFNKK